MRKKLEQEGDNFSIYSAVIWVESHSNPPSAYSVRILHFLQRN